MNLSKHKVLVTGGGSGIGLEIAREFVKRGNRVALCGRNLAKLKLSQSSIGADAVFRCDLAEEYAIPKLVAETNKSLGGLSILVNNAAIQYNYSFPDANPNAVLLDAAEEIQVNLTALIALTSACLPLLRENSSAAIVNISSGLAITPKASAPVYSATKAAVHSFSKSLRYQLDEKLPNIKVFEVFPPMVETKMSEGGGEGKMRPEEVAQAVFRGLTNDRNEIRIGKMKYLDLINRLFPSIAAKMLKD